MIGQLLVLLIIAIPGLAFDQAEAGYRYEFPRDHFAHPNFRTEWWYYTGNLSTPQGRRFGFELTFFRQAQREGLSGDSPWEIDDVHLAHLALSDIEGRTFHKTERLNRSGPGLAGGNLQDGRIWNGNWQVRWTNVQDPLAPQQLQAFSPDFDLDLTLSPSKPPVVHGVNGISPKGPAPGQASHYISFTRLEVSGSVRLSNKKLTVDGSAWMDHEFFTNTLAGNLAGWDWASVQLNDGSELMVYRLRRKDGTTDPHSAGTYVDNRGRPRHLPADDIVMAPQGNVWPSPTTSARYPLRWNISVPSLGIDLICTTPFPQQEVLSERGTSPNYWEGSVDYTGQAGGKPVRGVGYLELTGYDKPVNLGDAPE